MPHGLTKFSAQALVDKAEGALKLLESVPEDDGQGGGQGGGVGRDALHETLRVVLETQITIVETLELIKVEFDKFEEGLGKIL